MFSTAVQFSDMPLNPWRLRLLVRLQEHGTIRAVALHEMLSASAVSQQLGVLERETGTALLERTGRRVRLTAAGVILARRAREILAQMDAAERELGHLGEVPTGTVSLAAFQSAIHAIALPAVRRLNERHPDLEVVVLELEPHESMRALRRGDVDIIITTTDYGGTPLDAGVDLVPLGEDDIVLVLPTGHALEALEIVDLAALADHRWTFDVDGSYMSELATRLCREAGFEPRVACRFNNYLIALEHVEAGMSIALLPSLTLDARFAVSTRPLRFPVRRRIAAAARRPRAMPLAIAAVLAELQAGPHLGPREVLSLVDGRGLGDETVPPGPPRWRRL